MAALSADTYCTAVNPGAVITTGLAANAADTYYRGSIVYIDTAGGAQLAAAAGDRAVGISLTNQVIAASGDLVEVAVEGYFWLPVGTNIAAVDEGELLVNDMNGAGGSTDNPGDMEAAGDITPAANDICIGKILKVTSSQMLVHITPSLTGNLYVATAGWGG